MGPQESVDFVTLIDQPAWKTMLMEIVNGNKMDAWDIDIADLAEKYLQRISEAGGNDLRLPANAILASAILLKFKSKFLELSEIEEGDELFDRGLLEKERAELEAMLPSLRQIRKIREAKISLSDLVDSIELMLEKSRRKGGTTVLRKIDDMPEFRLPSLEKDIEKRMEDAMKLLLKSVDSENLVLFSHLVEGKDALEVIDTFIPLLFLANREKILLWQDEFFGEIYVALAQDGKGEKKEAK